MNNFFLVGWIVAILYVLLETDAVPKWGKLLRLKFLHIDEYEKKHSMFGSKYKYPIFLSANYPNFLVYLLTCQECLCVWLNILGYAAFHDSLRGWKTFGLSVLASWLAIASFNKVTKKLYE
jgi:hypothetical protein